MLTPFPKKAARQGRYANPDAKLVSPEFALGRLCRKVNNTKRLTGKSKPVATAAFLGVSPSLELKESKCCKSNTDLGAGTAS
jgi:hypothetical protein